MATPPTRVLYSTPAVGFLVTTSPKTTPTFDVVIGDLLTVMGTTQESPTTMPTPTTTGTVTWTLRQSISLTSYCVMYVWTGAVTADGTGITVSIAAGTGGQWGFGVTVWRNHGGVGQSTKTNVASGAPTLNITCGVNSALVCACSDYTATAGGSRVWRSVNGSAMSESLYATDSGTYTVYSGYTTDVGAAGAETVGLTTPTQKYSIVAVEILSVDAPPPPPAVSYVGQGIENNTTTGVSTAVTTINPTVHTDATTGDLSVLSVCMKPFGTTISDAGVLATWTKIGEATNGSVASGVDTGSTKVAVYVKESAATGAIGNITFGGSPNTIAAVINTYRKYSTYTWDYSQFTTGFDAASAANYSATGDAGIAIAADDWVVCSTAVNGDVGTQSAQDIGGMSGATMSAANVRTSFDCTTGNDSHIEVVDEACTAGSSSAAPTMTYTNASSGMGTSLWLRLREIAPAAVAVPLPVIVSRQAIRAPSYW